MILSSFNYLRVVNYYCMLTQVLLLASETS
jgi:hypothetical protein